MKRYLITTGLCAFALLFLATPQAMAQERVFNGDFQTASYTHGWTLFGGNTYTETAKFALGSPTGTWCLKRRPGPPSSNGGIEAMVPLDGGVTYTFSADIAAQYCST